MAKKTYVLDTSVYLTDAQAITAYANNNIIICSFYYYYVIK